MREIGDGDGVGNARQVLHYDTARADVEVPDLRISHLPRRQADITAALRRLDPSDPVRYDFSLCHLGMMGSCGHGTTQRDTHCPLKPHCRPKGG